MNKQAINFIVLAASLLGLSACSPVQPVAPNTTAKTLASNVASAPPSTVVTSKVVHYHTPLGLHSVRLFKSTNYPPQTAEEKAMWEWWDAMDKADPDFQWKMPIEFYGKVVDQFNQPVDGATVVLNWTTVIGFVPDPKTNIFTRSDGRFDVNGINGKRLWIAVSKEGYLPSTNSVASFEYASFYENNFYVPDRNNPVLFHLHKLMGAEPMYQFEMDNKMAFDGPPVVLDVASGKVAAIGDFAFSLSLDGRSERDPDYTLLLQAQNNAGFIFTKERFPFNAPENGYQTEMAIHQRATDTNYNSRQTFHFYAKTRDGKYGVVWFEVNVPRVGDMASCNATIRYNPSGSRNLEFDQNKWINR